MAKGTQQGEEDTISIFEERVEKMVKYTKHGIDTDQRVARFLKPCADHQPMLKIPTVTVADESSHQFNPLFKCWVRLQGKWLRWVDKMIQKYGPIWDKSNIRDAILSSRYEIHCNNNLIFGLVQFWHPDTNTFIFPWGEATITLEDVIVNGGFPVTGEDPVKCPLTAKQGEIKKALIKKRTKISTRSSWMTNYMEVENDGELEHVAFLSLWLSRFVFPSNIDLVKQQFFPLAIYLSRGRRIGLGPAVLAHIYRSLTRLKNQECDSVIGSLLLVQLWVFERFPLLRSHPPCILKLHRPWASRWNNPKSKVTFSLPLVTNVLQSKANFLWRPYTDDLPNWSNLLRFKYSGEVVFDPSSSDEDLHSFVKCLLVSKLVGFGCAEKYMPHRVGLQFGMDQDIPGEYSVMEFPRQKIRLFIAPASFEVGVGVSTRYFNWWKQLKLTEVSLPPVSRFNTGNNENESENFETGDDHRPIADIIMKSKATAKGTSSPDENAEFDCRKRKQFTSCEESNEVKSKDDGAGDHFPGKGKEIKIEHVKLENPLEESNCSKVSKAKVQGGSSDNPIEVDDFVVTSASKIKEGLQKVAELLQEVLYQSS